MRVVGPMFGLINLNKPAGVSTREALNCVQRLARPAKVGHAGTLDPIATGVLVACLGGATRLIEYVQQMSKRYRAWFQLGCWSPSDDIETEITRLDLAPRPMPEDIQLACRRFTGTIQQRPPIFSAIKVDGRRAYKLARKGRPLELAARPVTIHHLAVLEYAYPELLLEMECSSGTYVRSLGRDLAAALGTRAVMTGLERTAVGPFPIETAVDPRSLDGENLALHILPAVSAVPHLPRITLSAEEQTLVVNGRTIPQHVKGDEIAAVDPSGQLVAILAPRGEHELGPVRNFAAP